VWWLAGCARRIWRNESKNHFEQSEESEMTVEQYGVEVPGNRIKTR
jgi:hypothetical protein